MCRVQSSPLRDVNKVLMMGGWRGGEGGEGGRSREMRTFGEL